MSYVQNNGKSRLKCRNTVSYPKAYKHVKRQSSANTSVTRSEWNFFCKKTVQYVIGNLEFIPGKTKMVNKIYVSISPFFKEHKYPFGSEEYTSEMKDS